MLQVLPHPSDGCTAAVALVRDVKVAYWSSFIRGQLRHEAERLVIVNN